LDDDFPNSPFGRNEHEAIFEGFSGSVETIDDQLNKPFSVKGITGTLRAVGRVCHNRAQCDVTLLLTRDAKRRRQAWLVTQVDRLASDASDA
jgi:hypothetical protein